HGRDAASDRRTAGDHPAARSARSAQQAAQGQPARDSQCRGDRRMSPDDAFVERPDTTVYETDEPVQYRVEDGVAILTLSRPQFNNVQNSQMTYALDAAFRRAVDDDSVKVI